MWRKLARAVGCLGYLGLLGVVFALVSYFAFSQFVRRGVTSTPEIFGLSEEDAEALLADQGLRLEWTEERFDEQTPAGHVLIQRPRAGTLVKRGVTVTVIMSRGPQRIEVPTVVGTALQAAQVTLAAAGLTVGRTINVFSEDGAPGTVVAQEPTGGSRAERDAAIDLFLALENRSETYLMPDLVASNYEDVRRYFEQQGFRLGRVSYRDYGLWPPGTVLRQYPLAGHPLHSGDVIALEVVAPQEPAAELDGEEPGEPRATAADPTVANNVEGTP